MLSLPLPLIAIEPRGITTPRVSARFSSRAAWSGLGLGLGLGSGSGLGLGLGFLRARGLGSREPRELRRHARLLLGSGVGRIGRRELGGGSGRGARGEARDQVDRSEQVAADLAHQLDEGREDDLADALVELLLERRRVELVEQPGVLQVLDHLALLEQEELRHVARLPREVARLRVAWLGLGLGLGLGVRG